MGVLIWLVTFLIVVSSAAAKLCDRCLQNSRASISRKDFSDGACGYPTDFDVGGLYATAPTSVYNDGVGCGSCYQLSCTDETICSKEGVIVTVTDGPVKGKKEEQNTDFLMSKKAFMAMAKDRAKSNQFVNKGSVDVEYRRVPCNYGNKNMTIWVEDTGIPNNAYLDIVFLYKEGQTDITSVKVAMVQRAVSVRMVRNYGAIWHTEKAPEGDLKFNIVVTAGTRTMSNTTKAGVLPADWTKGKGYDSGLQFTNVVAKEENCNICG